jgi:hypothetical protein
MYTVTCSQCQQPIDTGTEDYLVLPQFFEHQATSNVYLHPGQCATDWEAAQRQAAQSPDNADGPQLKLF